jgi:hypothetical protein
MIAMKEEHGAAEERSRHPNRFSTVVTVAAQRDLVRRIVHSSTFGRSERLGSLLTYVSEMALKGREAEISEQKIGQAVFGRAEDYDSSSDGIVRSQASRLRQRLELYFQQEGALEPIRVVIPRGGYVPVFEAQPVAPTNQPADAKPEASEELSAIRETGRPISELSFYRWWLPWGLVALLALTTMGVWVYGHWRSTPLAEKHGAHPFWSQLFTKSDRVMIVAPDSGLVLYHGMSGKDIDLKEYLAGGYRSESNDPRTTSSAARQQEWLLDLANRRYTSMVDLHAVLDIRDRAKAIGSDVSVVYARDLHPNDLKRGTVVLLGAYTANPWVELYEPNLSFLLKDDYVATMSIVNRNPQAGEPAVWASTKNDPQRRAFGVIAFLPNLEGNGNALLLEGTGMSGTEAAMDFLDDDTQLLPFLNQIRRPDGSIPHFELLIETHNMGASAVQSRILAWRIKK